MAGRDVLVVAGGRRIDTRAGQPPRFPPENEKRVADEILSGLSGLRASRVLCSAACGADILVLEAAQQLRIPVRIILPFPPPVFRELSVADCGGNWAARYDQLLKSANATAESIRTLSLKRPGSQSDAKAGYRRVTEILIEEATELLQLRSDARASGMIIWDGRKKAANDETAYLRERLLRNRWNVLDVLTNKS